jgi:GNAT superfamily N-acetyltransferase
MRATDIDAGLRLCRLSGWNQTRRDWEQFLALNPGGACVAEYEGHVVGTVTTVRYGSRFGWIGMVLVDPAFRGRGIGTRLLDHALVLLSDMPLVRLDATAAGHDLYLTRQFVDEGLINRVEAVGPVVPSSAPDGVRPMAERDVPQVFALDQQVFGADRGLMLQWMWQGAPEYAWVSYSGDCMTGYAMGRHGHAYEHVGPIVAGEDETACRLVRACLGANSTAPFVIDAPAGHPSWQRSLEAMGFRHQRSLLRMAKGTGHIPGDMARQFAVLGPEFG